MPLTVYPLEVFGEMYQYNSPTVNAITINAVDAWEIIGGMSEGEIRNFIFQNSQELVCRVSGKYKINYSACWTDGVGNVYELSLFINGVLQTKTIACGRKGNSVDIVTSSSPGIIELTEGDVVVLKVRNRTTTTDFEVVSVNLNLNWVGMS